MTTPDAGSPLRQRMIEDMVARKLASGTQRGHVFACKQFAAYLGRSPRHLRPNPSRALRHDPHATHAWRRTMAASKRTDEPCTLPSPCPCCGGRMHVIETFEAGTMPRRQPSPVLITIRIDTS